MEEWKEYKLGELCDILDSKRIPLSSSQREKRKGCYPYYGAQGIIDYVDDYIFDGTYLLVAEDGENLKSRKQDIAQLVSGKYWVNNHAHILGSNGTSDIRLLCYILNKTDISGYITGSAQPKLNQANMQSIRLTLPSLPTQQKIANILSSLDDKIEVNRRINEQLEELAQALFNRMFFENKELERLPLSCFANINPTRNLSKGTEARYIEMANLPTRGSFPMDWSQKSYEGGMKFINGDTIMARITPCLENGKTAYIDFLDDCETAFGSTEYIVISAKEDFCPALFYFLARNKEFVDYAVGHMNGSSGRQRVSGTDIANFLMPNISIEASNQFADIAMPIMDVIRNNSLENRNLTTLRDTLLPKLMSGEIDVSEVEV